MALDAHTLARIALYTLGAPRQHQCHELLWAGCSDSMNTDLKTSSCIRFASRLSIATVASLVLCAGNALGAATINIAQSGADVVATFSGSINTDGATTGSTGFSSGVIPNWGFVSNGGAAIEFAFVSGPTGFGPGSSQVFATSSTGDVFGVFAFSGRIAVPVGYTSGAPISGAATLANTTVTTLGLTPGTYTYTWGSGGNADSLSVVIAAPNAAPTASSVSISGAAQLGAQLTGSYAYADAESDPQGTSTFRWVQNTVSTGVGGGTAVGTSSTYSIANGDLGRYLYFCVTPVASAGTTTGAEVCSAATSSVSARLTYASSSPTGSGTVNSEISGGGAGCGFSSSNYQTAASVAAAPPANLAFPHGVLNFTTTVCQSGGTVNVTITYPQTLPQGTKFYKYGPASANASPSWYEHPAVISGNTISYSVTDGQQGDGNSTAGVITDPGGAAAPLAGSGAQSIPTLSEWALLILSGLVALAAVFACRRRVVG